MTYEKQVENIDAARGSYWSAVSKKIRNGGYAREDEEKMRQIINAETKTEALLLYNYADTAVRDYLQEAIEEAINVRTQEENKQLKERYKLALDKIGGAAGMKEMTKAARKVFQETEDLKIKTEMLEAFEQHRATRKG